MPRYTDREVESVDPGGRAAKRRANEQAARDEAANSAKKRPGPQKGSAGALQGAVKRQEKVSRPRYSR